MIDTTHMLSHALILSMVHTLWLGGILFLFLKVLLCYVLNEKYQVQRYAASTGTLLLFITGWLVLFFHIYEPVSYTKVNTGFTAVLSGNLSFLQGGEDQPAAAGAWILLTKIYLLGVLLLLTRWIAGHISILRRARRGVVPGDSACTMIARVAEKAGLRGKVSVLMVKGIDGPQVWGVLKPVVMVPVGFFANMPAEHVELLLVHEFLHIRKYDHIINVLQSFFEILFFFNPFAWQISREIRVEREKRIDDAVLECCGDPENYARALYSLSVRRFSRTQLSTAASGGHRQELLTRIQRILNIPIMKTQIRNTVVVALTGILSAAGIIALSGFADPFLQKSSNRPVPAVADSPQAVVQLTVPAVPGYTAYDTIRTDTLTIEEWQQLKKELEDARAQLEAIDIEQKIREFEEQRQQLLEEVRIQVELEQQKLSEELARLNSEKIRAQVEMSLQKLDTAKIREEIEEAMRSVEAERYRLELALSENDYENEEMKMIMEKKLQALREIDSDHILEEMDASMEQFEIDLDMDLDIDFEGLAEINVEEIMEEIEVTLEEIDFDQIHQDIEEAMRGIEMELEALEEQMESGKIKK